MGGFVANKGTSRNVQRMVVDAQTLDRIADALGISRTELAGAESIEIHVGTPQPPAPPSGRTP